MDPSASSPSPSPSLRPDAAASAPSTTTQAPVSPDEPSGRVVVFWLFVALSIATAGALLYFGSIAPAPARPRIYTALVGNLALPVIAWYVYRNLKRHQPPAGET